MRKEIQDLIEKIRNEMSITDVIETRMDVNPRTRLCPFHEDRKAGSFQISEGKGIFKCFSCGASGDAIKFISMFDKISYTDAALKIGVEFGLITKEHYEKLSRNTFTGKQRKFVKKEKIKASEAALQDPDILDFVYRNFAKGSSLIDSSSPVLTKEHLDYLHGRGISDEEIQRFGYFSMPDRKILSPLKQVMKLHGLEATDLIGVPGFYREINTNRITMVSPAGVGIPIRDLEGRIIAIQIRKDKLLFDGDNRYTWFSSSFIYSSPKYNDLFDGGCSTGSPQDVILAENPASKAVLITEGHFKAAAFSKRFRCNAVSVQGVGNYRGIDEVLNGMEGAERVLIGFDADMETNLQVFKHTLGLVKLIRANTHLEPFYAVWDVRKGKGLDDLIDNKQEASIKFVRAETYQRFFVEYIKAAKERCHIVTMADFASADKEKLEEIYAELALKMGILK
jgi:DNA primase